MTTNKNQTEGIEDSAKKPSLSIIENDGTTAYEYDLMISYSWANKEIVHKIRDELTRRNLRAWIDDQNMSGSLYAKMAEGVRISKVFVPFLSAKYSASDNCRRELGFAIKQKKRIVPVRLDDDISDEVEFMTVNILYISIDASELSNELYRENTMNRLEKEIRSAEGEQLSDFLGRAIVELAVVSHRFNIPPLGTFGQIHSPPVTQVNAPPQEARTILKSWLKPVDMMDDYEALRLRHQKGTRQWFLEDVNHWINDDDRRAFWLKGAAGVGKSVMAALVVEELLKKGQIGGFFFCKHDNEDHNNPRRLITTLAFDLANSNVAVQNHLLKLQQNTPDIVEKSIPTCFHRLILEPLQQVPQTNSRIVLVLDALDECMQSRDRKDLLDVIGNDCQKLPEFVKLFLTSRPEEDITFAMKRALNNLSHRDMKASEENNQNDLLIYARERLSLRLYGVELEKAAQKLTTKSSGLFLWLRLACERLDVSSGSVLEIIEKLPIGMEGIYERIFKLAYEKPLEDLFVSVMGAIIKVEEPLSVSTLSKLIGRSEVDVQLIVNRLQSLLDIGNNGRVQVIHKSVTEFLTNAQRSNIPGLYINSETAHTMLALQCMTWMEKLLKKKNICRLNSFKLNSDIPDISSRQEKYIPDYLTYSCKYWVSHLTSSGSHWMDGDESRQKLLTVICKGKSLFWIEVMSILGETKAALQAMCDLEEWCHEQQKLVNQSAEPQEEGSSAVTLRFKELMQFAYDMQRLLQEFHIPISQSALQVYYSALPFSPKQSTVYQNYRSLNSRVSVIKGQIENWTPCLQILEGHSGWVSTVAVSPDGQRIVSGGVDRMVRVWDANTGEEVRTLEGHSSWVWAVAVSPDGQHIVSGSEDRTVRVWNLKKGGMRTLEEHPGAVWAVAVSLDGEYIVSGSEGAVYLWEITKGELVCTMTGHYGGVWAVAMSPDGQYVVSGGYDKTIRVWDADTGDAVRTLEGHSGWIWALAVFPDGQHIVSGGDDKTIRVWDVTTWEEVIKIEGHSSWVRAVAVLPDGHRIVSGGNDGKIHVWDVNTWNGICTLEGHPGGIFAVTVSPNGQHILSGGEDGTVRVWDANAVHEGSTSEGHSGWVRAVSVSPDGKQILSGGDDRTVGVWNAKTGEKVYTLEGHSGGVWALAVLQNGSLIVSGSYDGTIMMWNANTGEGIRTQEAHSSWVWAVALSPDGKHIVSGGNDHRVLVWDIDTGEVVHTLHGHSGWIRAVTLSPNGQYIVSGGDDWTIRVWDINTGVGIFILKGHTGAVKAISVSSDGQHIISGGEDRTVRVWNANTGEAVHTLNGYTGWSLLGNEKMLVISTTGWLSVTVIGGTSSPNVLFWIPPVCRGEVTGGGNIVVNGTPSGGIVVIKLGEPIASS